MLHLFALFEAAGLNPSDAVKCDVFLTDMNGFAAMNVNEQFQTPFPARTTIGVASLPLGAQIEIEMIALADSRITTGLDLERV